jgi:uncharacterized YccA/Bax inhibitor family protein
LYVAVGGLFSGGISSLLQILTIAKYVSQPQLWLLASALCEALNAMIYYGLFFAYKSQYDNTTFYLIVVCVSVGVIYGLITGIAMVLMPLKSRDNII